MTTASVGSLRPETGHYPITGRRSKSKLDKVVPKLVPPASLEALIAPLRCKFPSKASFDLFREMFLGQVFCCLQGPATVTGLITAAGHAHDGDWARYHEFFSRVDWSPDELGLVLAEMVLKYLQPEGVVRVVGDGTFWRRYGKHLAEAHYQHDPHRDSGVKGKRTAYGHGWVVLGLLVKVPGVERRVCLPILFRLAKKPSDGPVAGVTARASVGEQQSQDAAPTCSEMAEEMLNLLVKSFPDREFQLAVDAGFTVKGLHGERVTVITRTQKNASFREPTPPPTPPPTGRRGPGRPPTKRQGAKLPSLQEIALDDERWPWRELRDGAMVKHFDCVRPGSLGDKLVRVVIVHEPDEEENGDKQMIDKLFEDATCTSEKKPAEEKSAFTLALLCTNTRYSPEQIRAGYGERWGFETCMQEGKYVLGVGQQQSRLLHAVERAVPFGFLVQTLVTLWHATTCEPERAAERAKENAPSWYNLKVGVSLADMLVSFRAEALSESFQQFMLAAGTSRPADNPARELLKAHPPWLAVAFQYA